MTSSDAMKVLHYQHMGVGVILSEALQKLGIESRVLSSATHPFAFKEDFLLSVPLKPRRLWSKLFLPLEWRKYYRFDVLHSHDNMPLPRYVLEHWRRRLVQHYHDPKTKKRLYADELSLASMPGILKAIPEAIWIPIPVHTSLFTPEERIPHEGFRVGYCEQQIDPSKGKFIPKQEIKATVEKSRGRLSAYPLAGIIPHASMPRYYANIDVWVDRIGLDFYGFSAVEAASMGIPVIAQIGDEEINSIHEYYGTECPFVNVKDTDAIAEAILLLEEDEQLRADLGEKARQYILHVHDSIKVAQTCREQYELLGK